MSRLCYKGPPKNARGRVCVVRIRHFLSDFVHDGVFPFHNLATLTLVKIRREGRPIEDASARRLLARLK